MKTLLITGDDIRHRYAANKLHEKRILAAIVAEKKASPTSHLDSKHPQDKIYRHFAERLEVEDKLLGPNEFPNDVPLLSVENGDSSTPKAVDWVNSQQPDLILLYGSSVIRGALLKYYESRIINVHLGLSPYYRGSGTNFWPLVHRIPECVGATIHLATPQVDAGNIIWQVRPEGIVGTDRAHELGTKTIITVFSHLSTILNSYFLGEIIPKKQDISIGTLCRRRDFTNEAVNTLWENLANTMIPNYLTEKRVRDEKYPIVSLLNH